ncbi:asparagine synthase-related protein [Candidatus Micrarchaeota archaeon]|nr:asparagine synthase-related protein [Candidatus Micrarchaeota archaeon]
MDKRLEKKLSSLRERIRRLDSAVVAFSGGVDSSFLMRICREELGEKAVAVTALSDNYPRSELSVARRVAKIIGVKHVVFDPSKSAIDTRASRSANMIRNSNLYSSMKCVAMRMKLKHVLDGSHQDDADERGRSFLEARRAGVRSPLLESNLSKAEIRLLARELRLPNWDKPPSSSIKPGKAAKAGKDAEKRFEARAYLLALCPRACVRLRGKNAYIIAGKCGMVALARRITSIRKRLKSLGFSEVFLKPAE